MERVKAYHILHELYDRATPEQQEALNIAQNDIQFMDLLGDTLEPVRHGRWELHGNDDDCGCSYFCSECHKSYDEDWFYTHGEYTPFKCCPNCRAKMDKED